MNNQDKSRKIIERFEMIFSNTGLDRRVEMHNKEPVYQQVSQNQIIAFAESLLAAPIQASINPTTYGGGSRVDSKISSIREALHSRS